MLRFLALERNLSSAAGHEWQEMAGLVMPRKECGRVRRPTGAASARQRNSDRLAGDPPVRYDATEKLYHQSIGRYLLK